MSKFIERALIASWSVVVFFLGGAIMSDAWKAELIEHGYGLYCPDNGAFAFKGECGE